ncbi:hypothetical protein [Granulicella sp. S190]|uniref:hypothetical protein n=1 Tax=Granulicella sp. S190 TaxID=1747226 RepID=UPI00131ADAA0|nr:hypothetical protein [Granulicella sp. S190]
MSAFDTSRCWSLLFALAASFSFLPGVPARSQTAGEIPAIGQINFFGYGGINIKPIEAALPIQIGTVLSVETLESTQGLLEQRIRTVLGHEPTNIDFVCCDENHHLLVYIGLGGTTSQNPSFHPIPKGTDSLQPAALRLYKDEMDALMLATKRGSSAEDDSKGYALATDPALRKIQTAMRAYARDRAPEFERVLKNAADFQQRLVSAALLGYSQRSSSQVQGLTDAVLDSEPEVRNNAVRALMVLASVKQTDLHQLTVEPVEALLLSGVWSDRNKASLLLNQLTASRDPAMLRELHTTALDAIIEGASWHGDPGHAGAFVILLGRIAKLPEERFFPTPDAEAIADIIKQARAAY